MSFPEIMPSRKRSGVVDGLFSALGKEFVTAPVDELELTYEGIRGDLHSGITRKSGSREPWYTRGTEMRNERQVTILSRSGGVHEVPKGSKAEVAEAILDHVFGGAGADAA